MEYGRLREVSPVVSVLLEHNPGPMTLEGTNTWVLRAPGERECVIVDPGEEQDEEHLQRVAAQGPVARILITHRHHDHCGSARKLATLTGAPVHALDPSVGSETLRDGEVVAAAGLEFHVVATPGHTTDSTSFLVHGPGEGPPPLLAGDMILGHGTTVIAHPDGALAPYLSSLDWYADLPPGTLCLTGHGPELPDAAEIAKHYRTHRGQRLEQVRAALQTLPADATPRQVVETVYADVDQALWDAAELSVKAQLDYIRG
ncbi:MBL fold metallo-hydrolase [Pseudonocardia sp. WMMC193]|uniref:MBL fold metallo-hydrolase n=1 Tax=Pseudonocardia sp. WMMC193 TaxID=2911965 RepID=UPI001F25592A|nr:MBL fold metallo-hydrolase [Pseudonocardia sp. WMMC193]MCF7552141.1 MBL fold metallo-hydrolase [Pseudonocardia sp. WMMC193]